MHVNFLHKFNVAARQEWTRDSPALPPDIADRMINTNPENRPPNAFDGKTHRVANYSLVIWNNFPISIYRKSTYCNEANTIFNSVNTTYAYEFGDFQSHQLVAEGIHQQIANIFAGNASLIMTRICADMNKEAFLAPDYLNQNTILILPAKDAPPYNVPQLTVLRVDDHSGIEIKYSNSHATGIVSADRVPYNTYCGCCFRIEANPPQQSAVSHRESFYDRAAPVETTQDEEDGCCCFCW